MKTLTRLLFLAVLLFASPAFALEDVYYSVCPFGTGDIKIDDGTITCTISSGVMTVSDAQTGNIGQGCRITYDTNKVCYISAVNSAASFDVVTALGAAAADEGVAVDVESIAHEYDSLSAAEAGFTDADHVNNTDLTSADVIANLVCYYDHDDYTASGNVTIDFGTDDSTRYVHIYSANGGTQSIKNNRHSGIWDDNKFKIVANGTAITSLEDYTHITGIQCKNTSTAGNRNVISLRGVTNTGVNVVDKCIITDTTPASSTARNGISLDGQSGANISNTVIYNFSYDGSSYGINKPYGARNTINITNCTIYDAYTGIYIDANSTVTVKNTAVFNCSDDFSGTISTIDYCASDDGDGSNPQTLVSTSDYAAEFTDVTTCDFTLISGGVCVDNGTNTGAPSDDIIGTSRPQNTTTDIGAFEYISVGTPTNFQVIFFE